MYAQLVHFPGPRSAELVAAGDRAGTERIEPIISAEADLAGAIVASFVLRRPDGDEVVLVVTETAEALKRGNELIAGSSLLPGEDPALLPGPGRIDTYEVIRAYGRGFVPMGARS